MINSSRTKAALGVLALLVLGACANPKETVVNNPATRAGDRAAGTNVSGAYPAQSDATPANPSGTAATRTFDRAAGTNTSGAYPQQSDGTPVNPPGTAASRTTDRALGTDMSGAYSPNQQRR